MCFLILRDFPLDDGGLEYLWGCTFVDENGKKDNLRTSGLTTEYRKKKAFQEFYCMGLWTLGKR